MGRVEESYRGYRIIAGTVKGKAAAKIYLGKKPQYELTASTVDEAVRDARVWTDEQYKATASRRRAPHVGTTEEYVAYFAGADTPDYLIRLLQAHARAPNGAMTPSELAAVAGWTEIGAVNLHYGWLGAQVAEALRLNLKHESGEETATTALADWV